MSVNLETVNVLLVDDEKEACDNLKNMLSEYIGKEVNVLGVANNTRDAEKMVNELKPEAIFLDIEMPNENAFQFLERISPVSFDVLFVTAYDEYAIKAFKLNAVDYILKPISISELKEAVQKLIERVRYKKLMKVADISYEEIGKVATRKVKGQKITLKDGNNIDVVDFRNIFFIEAQGSYSRLLYINDNVTKEKIMSTPLSAYEELMPEDMFYRIHKSYLINCMHVKTILRDEVTHVDINNEFTLPVSRRRLSSLIAFLKNNDYYDE